MAIILQKPKIVEIVGSTIRIAHPDISGYTRTSVGSPIAASGTTLTVLDNNNFENNDFFIIGEPGDRKTEADDVNGAVTRGTSLTVTNTLKFGHEIDAPVTRIFETTIAIYSAATDGGSLTEVVAPAAAIDIAWDQPVTEYTYEGTAASFYVVKFYDGTTLSAASDYIPSTGLTASTAQEIINSGLDIVGEVMDDKMFNKESCLRWYNEAQDRISHYVLPSGIRKDWSHELTEDTTSISITENENKYALSGLSSTIKEGDTKQTIVNVRLGTTVLDYKDIHQHDEDMADRVKGVVASAASAGDTTLTLDDSYEFDEDGSIDVPGQTAAVTYTANAETTGILSGIPASGDGAITVTTVAEDATVWQGVESGDPEFYTIYNGNIELDIPPDSDLASYKLKIKYLKEISRITDLSETSSIPFYHIIPYFIAARAEQKKGRVELARMHMGDFERLLADEAKRDKYHITDTMEYRDSEIETN